MRIITAANPRYYPRITPYLTSLVHHSQIPVTLVCVTNGEAHDPGWAGRLASVTLTPADNYGAPVET